MRLCDCVCLGFCHYVCCCDTVGCYCVCVCVCVCPCVCCVCWVRLYVWNFVHASSSWHSGDTSIRRLIPWAKIYMLGFVPLLLVCEYLGECTHLSPVWLDRQTRIPRRRNSLDLERTRCRTPSWKARGHLQSCTQQDDRFCWFLHSHTEEVTKSNSRGLRFS